MSLSIRDKMRSRAVLRWHTVGISGSQSVSEHSHCMSIIAEELLSAIVQENVSIEDKYYILKYAQVHDIPEVLLSDISSPVRSFLNEASVDFEEIMNNLEVKLVPELAEINAYFDKNKHLHIISKLADYLEAYSYIATNKGGDEQHNNVVIEKLDLFIGKTIIKGEKEFPSLNWNAVNEMKHELVDGDSAILRFEKYLQV